MGRPIDDDDPAVIPRPIGPAPALQRPRAIGADAHAGCRQARKKLGTRAAAALRIIEQTDIETAPRGGDEVFGEWRAERVVTIDVSLEPHAFRGLGDRLLERREERTWIGVQ